MGDGIFSNVNGRQVFMKYHCILETTKNKFIVVSLKSIHLPGSKSLLSFAYSILSPTEKQGEVDRLNIKFAEVESQLLRSRACEARRSWLSTSVNLKETARGALE